MELIDYFIRNLAALKKKNSRYQFLLFVNNKVDFASLQIIFYDLLFSPFYNKQEFEPVEKITNFTAELKNKNLIVIIMSDYTFEKIVNDSQKFVKWAQKKKFN